MKGMIYRIYPKRLRIEKGIIKDNLSIRGKSWALNELKEYFFSVDRNKNIKKTINNLSKNYEYFIDIGSARGDITMSVADNFKKCFCFEPFYENFEELQKNLKIEKISNVETNNLAIGEIKGEFNFYCSIANKSDNRFKLAPNEKAKEKTVVKMDSLDNIFLEKNIKKFIIKMDVQGYEFHVIKGAKKFLENDCIIITEFQPWLLKLHGTEPLDFVEYIKKSGFEIFDLNHEKISDEYLEMFCKKAVTKKFVWDDFLLMKK
jgi:FkbM family methyltransferase